MHALISLNEKKIQEYLKNIKNSYSGFYNKNYKIEYNGVPYILRIPITDAVSMDMRFIAEEDILEFLTDKINNIPRVVMNKTYNGQKYFLHNFIPGSTIEEIYPECEIMPDWIIKKTAGTMIQLHKIPLNELNAFLVRMPWKTEVGDFYDYIYEYNKRLIEKYQSEYKEYYNFFGMPPDISNFIRYRKDELNKAGFVLAHSDIHRKNIIINNDIQDIALIDWELTLITPLFYDISIHLHKMRYTKEQEELFLNTYFELSGIDGAFAKKQIKLYRDIEEVKSAAIDIVRYLSIINEISQEQIISNAKRYYTKLVKAYICWEKDPSTLVEDKIISFFMDKRN